MTTPIIKDKDLLLDWFRSNQMVKFTLYRGHVNDSKHRLYNQDDDKYSMEEAVARLDTLLKMYDDRGDFYLFVTEAKNGTGGGFQTLVSLYGVGNNGSNNSINGTGSVPNGYVGLESVNTIVENAVLKLQLQQLQDQVNGLQNTPSKELSAWENMMKDVLQDEGSGKEIAIGLRDMFRGFGF